MRIGQGPRTWLTGTTLEADLAALRTVVDLMARKPSKHSPLMKRKEYDSSISSSL